MVNEIIVIVLIEIDLMVFCPFAVYFKNAKQQPKYSTFPFYRFYFWLYFHSGSFDWEEAIALYGIACWLLLFFNTFYFFFKRKNLS